MASDPLSCGSMGSGTNAAAANHRGVPHAPLPHAPRQWSSVPQTQRSEDPSTVYSQSSKQQQEQQLHSPDRHSSSAPQQRLLGDLLAGFLTSAVYTTATYPVHRVKVLLQTQDANPRIISGKVKRYSFVHSFARIASEQGMAGLWRGNTPYLMRHVPSISMSFAFKDAIRSALPQPNPAQHPWSALCINSVAGGIAGAVALAVVYPFEFATVRLAADVGGGGSDRQYGTGMASAWRQAMAVEGLGAAYRGFGVAVASMAAYKSLYFGLYDTAKPLVFGSEAQSQLGGSALAMRTLLAAATTFTAASITYPLDIIRKRLIVDAGAEQHVYSGGLRGCVAAIWQHEGVRGFYRFYWYDMFFRLGGGLIQVGYDVLRDLGSRSRNGAAGAAAELLLGGSARDSSSSHGDSNGDDRH